MLEKRVFYFKVNNGNMFPVIAHDLNSALTKLTPHLKLGDSIQYVGKNSTEDVYYVIGIGYTGNFVGYTGNFVVMEKK